MIVGFDQLTHAGHLSSHLRLSTSGESFLDMLPQDEELRQILDNLHTGMPMETRSQACVAVL